MLSRLKHMLIKEFIQILRDPRMRAVILIVPIVQTMVFGFAVSTDVRDIKTAVYDTDNSIESREMMARLKSSGYFDTSIVVQTEDQVVMLMDSGNAKAVFRITAGFGAHIRAHNTAQLQVILDGTDSTTANIILGYTMKIAAKYSTDILIEQLRATTGKAFEPDRIVLASRAWFNENLTSRNFYVPGVIALLVMLVTLMLSSMAIVREKEIGTIEQIMVTPISQFEFILGKTIPFALIGFLNVLLITVLALLVFDVPLRGSLPLLLLGTAFYLLSSLGMGLFISTVSSTQQQAMMSTFFFFFPAVLLSGFVFPIANMPIVVQWVTYVNPLRYFLVIVRGIFLKGVGFEVLWPQMAALAVLGSILVILASLRFKKTIS